jgi:hypothetical protein
MQATDKSATAGETRNAWTNFNRPVSIRGIAILVKFLLLESVALVISYLNFHLKSSNYAIYVQVSPNVQPHPTGLKKSWHQLFIRSASVALVLTLQFQLMI